MLRSLNRKLLVSVYTAQEAREAVLGGGRIIDSEDPKSALGNISPLKIVAIRDAVLDYARDLDVQLSTNIGEDQLIFRRSASGRAIQKSPEEMAGKAAQAALGVAISMGTEVHPCSIVKVGLDGMDEQQLVDVLGEVVRTLRRTPALKQCPVMSVLFAQNLEAWNERKLEPSVRAELVSLREFSPRDEHNAAHAFRLADHWKKLSDENGAPLPDQRSEKEDLVVLKQHGILPEDAKDDYVVVNELMPHDRFLDVPAAPRTTREAIKKMVDITVEAGADAMMLDTSVLSKVSNICLVDTSGGGMAHLSPHIKKNGLAQQGILGLEDLKFFVEYAHFAGIVPNIAGSVDSIQAQQLWALLPQIDQVSTRGAASGAVVEPGANADANAVNAVDTRRLRTIVRQLVSGLAPPEHGGVLNLPVALRDLADAQPEIQRLVALLRDDRAKNRLPELRAYYVDSAGKVVAEVEPPAPAPAPNGHPKSAAGKEKPLGK